MNNITYYYLLMIGVNINEIPNILNTTTIKL
jgi:hypothetical protein